MWIAECPFACAAVTTVCFSYCKRFLLGYVKVVYPSLHIHAASGILQREGPLDSLELYFLQYSTLRASSPAQLVYSYITSPSVDIEGSRRASGLVLITGNCLHQYFPRRALTPARAASRPASSHHVVYLISAPTATRPPFLPSALGGRVR